MKIYNRAKLQVNDKRTVFLDVDDVVLFSTERIIELINEEKTKNGEKLVDIKNYTIATFRNYNNAMTQEKLGKMFDSESFFEGVKFNEELIQALEENEEELFNYFNWAFVTKGSKENHIRKVNLLYSHPFFNKHQYEIDYYGLEMKENKAEIIMMDGIQIDDMVENLKETIATVKILFKNEKENEFNRINKTRLNLPNLYITDTTKELVETINFIKTMEQTREFNFYEGIEE